MMKKAGNTVEAVAVFWEIDYTCVWILDLHIHVSLYKIEPKLQSEHGQFRTRSSII